MSIDEAIEADPAVHAARAKFADAVKRGASLLERMQAANRVLATSRAADAAYRNR